MVVFHVFKLMKSYFVFGFVLLVLATLYLLSQGGEEVPTYVIKTSEPEVQSVPPPPPTAAVHVDELDEFSFTLGAFQKISGAPLPSGKTWQSVIAQAFEVPNGTNKTKAEKITALTNELVKKYESIHRNFTFQRIIRPKTGLKINLAVIACGGRRSQALTMLKSAAVFSQDSDLHIIAFSDKGEIFNVAKDLFELRWQANAAGWDFTFEQHLEWFPSGTNWKSMYAQCATQRLFFPSLLPHIDSLVYLDSDTVMLSNLTEFYTQFQKMNNTKLAAAAANNEPVENNGGYYRSGMSKIPFWSTHGLNAGIMLMNLTLMRKFQMQERCVAAQAVYHDKLVLADQDIYNIIFHTYPELFHELPCTYNFYWAHCGLPNVFGCYNASGAHTCWCRGLDTTGLHIAHGNMGSFSNQHLHFLPAIYNGFSKLDITQESPLRLVKHLEEDYLSKPQNHCHRLTADMLYQNAKVYLYSLYKDE